MPNHLQSAYLKLVKTKEISLNENQLILIKKLDCLLTHLNKNEHRLFKKNILIQEFISMAMLAEVNL